MVPRVCGVRSSQTGGSRRLQYSAPILLFSSSATTASHPLSALPKHSLNTLNGPKARLSAERHTNLEPDNLPLLSQPTSHFPSPPRSLRRPRSNLHFPPPHCLTTRRRHCPLLKLHQVRSSLRQGFIQSPRENGRFWDRGGAVSYTHLTLPTNREV